MDRSVRLTAIAALLLLLPFGSCRREATPSEHEKAARVPVTDAEKRAHGDAILRRMSEKLQSAPALSFSTTENIERIQPNKGKFMLDLHRDVIARQPDRLWLKTTGDRELEGFYDGADVTIFSHRDKVWGQFKGAPTLDETTDIITRRYDIPLPIAGLLVSDPEQSMLGGDATTGGWQKQETLNGIKYDVLSYQHPNADFFIWIPVAGDPLPGKLYITDKAKYGQPSTSVEFRNWNLTPQVSDDTFAKKVPHGYEGIPVIQRGVIGADRYEDYEAWRAVAGTGATIPVGTMLDRPPAVAKPVMIAGTTCWRHENTYFARVFASGAVAYQVVPPPQGT